MSAFEKHYTIRELSEKWGYSAQSIRRLLHRDAELRALCPDLHNIGCVGKREIHHRRVPESLVPRVYSRLLSNAAQMPRTIKNPLRVKFLGNGNTGMPKKPRNLLKLSALKQFSDGEGVS